MALYALQEIENAARIAREFLTPIETRRWLKLALIVLFASGGTSFSTSLNAGSAPPGSIGEFPVPSIGRLWPVIGGLVVALVVLAVVWRLISAIMEFVFVESLRTGDVTIQRYWRAQWRQGLRLFGFRIAIAVPMFLLIVAFLALFVLPVFLNVGAMPILGAFILLPLLALVGLATSLVNGFTTVFVVPIMIQMDCTVLDGWRRLWTSIRTDWKQYFAYLVLQFVLLLGLGIAAMVVLSLVALIVLIPLVVVGYVALTAVSLSSTVGLATVAVLVTIFALSMLAASATVQVPIQTYLRYYALLLLGDVEPELDLIPERRADAERR